MDQFATASKDLSIAASRRRTDDIGRSEKSLEDAPFRRKATARLRLLAGLQLEAIAHTDLQCDRPRQGQYSHDKEKVRRF